MKRMKRIISISIALLLAGSALADTYRVSYTLRGSGKRITVNAESSSEARRVVMDMFPGMLRDRKSQDQTICQAVRGMEPGAPQTGS
jgi:hypothetical protein